MEGFGELAFLLPALSRERIEAALRANDWHYQVDEDGDLCGLWGDNQFYLFATGENNEILYVRGRWHQALPIESRTEAREVLDDWHRDRLWPKGFTRVNDEGELRVFGELVIDFEQGVTDAQLEHSIRCAISTSLQMFDELAEHFGK